ncbi:MAG TPA: ChrR family anti-sigma-E factor [Rhizomicrobium sp.]|jgi:putative transcriptional regulator|nr:ChrR family anti-sigma-E factor [Rhizomicrobium sp.]
MSILHHPGEDMLLDYASGAGGEAISLVVATHLAFCSQCRKAVARAEAMGGALMDKLSPAAMGEAALAATLARLDAPAAPVTAPPLSQAGVPGPLRPYLKGGLANIAWRHMGPRLAYLPLFRRGGLSVKLLKGVAGADTGSHSHRGMEFTLVLQGGFTDVTGSYAPGDLQIADSDTWHNPVADPGEDCINLAVTTAPLRFKGLVPTIAGKLFGF